MRKKGISLIVLVITIIIMIILATSVILSLSSNNITTKASQATFKNDLKIIQQQYESFNANELIKSSGEYDSGTLIAKTDSLKYNTKTATGGNVYTIFPDMPEYLKGKIRITNGRLIFESKDDNETVWAQDIGIANNAHGIVKGVLESSEFATSFIKNGVLTIPNYYQIIGTSAYYGNKDITKVVIPSTITTIGTNAFYECTNLKEVEIEGETLKTVESNAFRSCTKLGTINLPGSVKNLASCAFYECTNLKSITLPNSITAMGTYVFSRSGLTSISLPDRLISKSGNESFGSYAFDDCDKLASVKLPESSDFTIIPSYCFRNCEALKKVNAGLLQGDVVNLPTTITTIRDSAFANTGITGTVTIPAKTSSLAINAFPSGVAFEYAADGSIKDNVDNNGYLINGTTIKKIYDNAVSNEGELTIPDSVTAISSGAITSTLASRVKVLNLPASFSSFSNILAYMTNLETITVVTGNTALKIGEGTDKSLYSKDGKTLMFYVSGSISSLVTNIGAYSFKYSTTSVTIPDNVTTINSYAFSGCSNLEIVTLPDTLKTIGNYAFNGCSHITNIDWPNSLITISDCAFLSTGLTSLNLTECTNLTTIGNQAFGSSKITEIKLPGNSGLTISPLFVYSTPIYTSTTYKSNSVTIGTGSKYSIVDNVILESGTKLFLLINNPSGTFTIPSVVTTIGDYAFHNKKNITSIVIPSGVTTIGSSFQYCSGATSIIIPEGVTTIGSAFQNCTALTNITIPSTVTSLSSSAFTSCGSKLTSITINQNKYKNDGSINSLNSNSPFGLIYGARCINWLDY